MNSTLPLARNHTRRAAMNLTPFWQQIGLDTCGNRTNIRPSQNARYFSHISPKRKTSSPKWTEQPPTSHDTANQPRQGNKHHPLSVLPLAMILRSLFTSTVSSSPKLLAGSLCLLRILAHTKVKLLDPDHNRLLRYVLYQSIYKQFCAGKDADKVAKTVAQGKSIGFTGTILAYAKESPEHGQGSSTETVSQNADREISEWLKNSLETVRLVTAGDFVALKFTGAGSLAHEQLLQGSMPGPYLADSIDRICALARERGVRVLIDGEQDALQDTIDRWTMHVAKKYNTVPGKAMIFGTYQAYKKTAPAVLASHLREAREGEFTLGVKLVRGAYLHSDPAERLHDTKDDTDACYDSAAASVLTREWNATVAGSGAYPPASIMFATHNATSVRRAYSIYTSGRARSEILFAQLQGMADEISCELVEMNRPAALQDRAAARTEEAHTFLPVYKYMAWGTTGECMKYLLRRAEENKDAVKRTREDRDAMWAELVRRTKGALFHGSD